jgi:dolichol-phosphate mannosyltransferase
MYNEEDSVAFLRSALTEFMAELHGEVEAVLVNDGSTDGTLLLLAEWAAADRRVKVIHLSRNFGHQLAATAGLDYATGDAIVLMDADLQDPLAVVHEMLQRYREGYDVVYGQRTARVGETIFKRFTAWLFYRLMRSASDGLLPLDTGDFRLISRECLDALRRLREQHRFLRGMVAWVGYAQCAVPYKRAQRMAGVTKYSLFKMLRFAWTAATSFSTLPLRMSIMLGLVFFFFAVEEAVRALWAWTVGRTVPGWTSVMLLMSVTTSAMLLGIGVVGQYVGRIYEETKGRPLYLVARTFNTESHSAPIAAAGQGAGRTAHGHE